MKSVTAALRDCMGAIDAMATQIKQMRGLFPDEDGTIAEALEAGDEAIDVAHAALDGIKAEQVPNLPHVLRLLVQACDYAQDATLDGDELPAFIEEARALIASHREAIAPVDGEAVH